MTELTIDTEHRLHIDLSEVIGESIAVIGMKGSGKTTTVGVLVEELLMQGLPMTIIDPQGEMWGLKSNDAFTLLVAGRSEQAEIRLDPERAGELAECSLRRGISVILDLVGYSTDERFTLLSAYFERLWQVAEELKRPYEVVFEEARTYIPQNGNTPVKAILRDIVLLARKYGVGTILANQRSANVDKDILTQAGIYFLHNVTHAVDQNIYTQLVPLPSRQVKQMISQLERGSAIVVQNHQPMLVHVRARSTYHVGATPTFETSSQPVVHGLDPALLEELRALLTRPPQEDRMSLQLLAERRRNEELSALLAEKQAEIARLQERIELLSKLTVSVPAAPRAEVFGSAAHLSIETASVSQMQVAHLPLHPYQEVSATPTTQTLSAAPSRERLLNKEDEQRLRAFKQRIEQLPDLAYKLLYTLHLEPKAMSREDAILALGISGWTFDQKKPHQILLRKKLIKLTPRGNKHFYTSTVRDQIQSMFPHVENRDALASEMFLKARV
jgi:hypothetical protein